MDETVATYFGAWNERDVEQRRRLLEESVTGNVELVDPTGRCQGIAGRVTIRYVLSGGLGSYSLLEWLAPAGTPSPPVHIHRETDEGFYVLEGTYGFLVDDRHLEARAGEHVLVPRGHPHTFRERGQGGGSLPDRALAARV